MLVVPRKEKPVGYILNIQTYEGNKHRNMNENSWSSKFELWCNKMDFLIL